MRIFRDEASLSANPHLWSSITEALDESSWFVLLMSPDAAESRWVNDEVEYWLEHKDPGRIIPVLTDGEFGWANDDISGDSFPRALVGAFTDEPRWVDLRFARTEEQLDLNNPTFSAAIADIASPIRGVPKDELESEEVRQHRRSIRTAWAAGAGLLILAVLAGAAALYAIDQRDATAEQRDLAEQSAAEAESQRDTASVAAQSEAEARSLAEQETERANTAASYMLDYINQLSGADAPVGDYYKLADFTPSDRVADSLPDSERLDFLFESCSATACRRDAAFINEEHTLSNGVWPAYRPFHIRHGFVNQSDQPLTHNAGYDLRVYITRLVGPELPAQAFQLDTHYLFFSDYLVRELSDACGPSVALQEEILPCDRFVHEFPEGLPPGRYAFWVEWIAPCSTWPIADMCTTTFQRISLFASSVESPFINETWNEGDQLPYDPWDAFDTMPIPPGSTP